MEKEVYHGDTIKNYNDCYGYFSNFLDYLKKETNTNIVYCKDVYPEIMEDFTYYMSDIKETKLETSTINGRIVAIGAFFNFCFKKHFIISFEIGKIKQQEKQKQTFTKREAELLLAKPDIKLCSFTAYRNWVIACFLSATGVRLRTLIHIKIEDLDFDNLVIFIGIQKNKKTHYIEMEVNLYEILKEYLFHRGGSSNDYLFPTRYGKQFTRGGMNETMREYNSSRGVEKLSIHLYRHYFSQNFMKKFKDIHKLKRILNHSSVTTTEIYLQGIGIDPYNRDNQKMDMLSDILTESSNIKVSTSKINKNGGTIRMKTNAS